jgi:hypothetical protein
MRDAVYSYRRLLWLALAATLVLPMYLINSVSAVVGPTAGGDGTYSLTSTRIGRQGEQIVTSAHGYLYEPTIRGQVYTATTGATGRAPGTALGTTPPILLYNPVGSGYRLSIKRVSVGYISGTLGAGTLFHAVFTINGPVGTQSNVVPVIGTGAAITLLSADIGAGNDGTSSAFAAGTLNANPVLLYPFCTLEASLATSTNAPNTLVEEVNGGICLEQGTGWCMEAIAAAGTSPLLCYGVVYERVPLVGGQ